MVHAHGSSLDASFADCIPNPNRPVANQMSSSVALHAYHDTLWLFVRVCEISAAILNIGA